MRGAGLSMLSRGFSLGWLTCARAAAFIIRVHSQRETWVHVATPHGFDNCKSSREQRLGSPAGQYLGSVSSYPSSSVVTWDCASSFAPARLSRAPRPGCDSPPRPFPGVSPCQKQGVSISLTRLLLVIHNTTLTRHHSFLTPSGHTFSG